MAQAPAARGSFPARLHRRDLDQDQHDPPLRLGQTRQQAGRQGPSRTWKTSTFLAALRCDRVEAPCLFDGPINGERFLAYVKEFLIPTLKPNDIVVADNLGLAQRQGRAAGHPIRRRPPLLLPKYSPDLNPIEQVFAKVKTLVRKAEPRTFDAIPDALKNALAQVPPSECANYLRNAGYAYA